MYEPTEPGVAPGIIVAFIVVVVLREEFSLNLVPQFTRPIKKPGPAGVKPRVPLSLPSNQRVLVAESTTKLSPTPAFALLLALIVANSIAIDKTDQPKTLRITILQN